MHEAFNGLGVCVPDPSARPAGMPQPDRQMKAIDLNPDSSQQQLQALSAACQVLDEPLALLLKPPLPANHPAM